LEHQYMTTGALSVVIRNGMSLYKHRLVQPTLSGLDLWLIIIDRTLVQNKEELKNSKQIF